MNFIRSKCNSDVYSSSLFQQLLFAEYICIIKDMVINALLSIGRKSIMDFTNYSLKF